MRIYPIGLLLISCIPEREREIGFEFADVPSGHEFHCHNSPHAYNKIISRNSLHGF